MVHGVYCIPVLHDRHAPEVSLPLRRGTEMASGFLGGPENRIAREATLAVSKQTTGFYNPLVFHGPSGSGKSLLARTIAAAWRGVDSRSGDSQTRFVYTAAEELIRRSDAVRKVLTGTSSRDTLLLIVEDLHCIGRDERGQRKLAAIVDAVTSRETEDSSRSQIVITSRVAPAVMPGLRPSLKSRLATGLVVPVWLPSLATKSSVLQILAQSSGVNLPPAVADLLARLGGKTVSECVLALSLIATSARAKGSEIDAVLVREHLAGVKPNTIVPTTRVVMKVARYFSLKVTDLRGRSRQRPIAMARSVAFYLARQLSGKSLEQIGRDLGGRDHTTVLHHCRKVENLLVCDPYLRGAIDELQSVLEAGGPGKHVEPTSVARSSPTATRRKQKNSTWHEQSKTNIQH